MHARHPTSNRVVIGRSRVRAGARVSKGDPIRPRLPNYIEFVPVCQIGSVWSRPFERSCHRGGPLQNGPLRPLRQFSRSADEAADEADDGATQGDGEEAAAPLAASTGAEPGGEEPAGDS
eukprot:495056-Prorocentrum_minimum.AAC.1